MITASVSTANATFYRGTLFVGLLLLAGISMAASSLPARANRTSIGGVEYMRLNEWANSYNFQLRWTVPQRELRLTGAWSSLAFATDSRRCQVGGVTVWLSHSVVVRNGSAWIATRDVVTALNPILSPSRTPGRKIKTICIDPGHGGKDPGNRDGRQQEKTYTLLLARELSKQLSAAGFNVAMTRSSDTFIELPTRPELAKRRRADLFLSLHFNAVGSPGGASVEGAEVYCLTPPRASSTNARGEGAGTGAFPGNQHDSKNMLLAYHMQKALVYRLGAQDRGVKRARFAVLRSAEMPTVLIEGGFMTHPGEAKKIYDAAYQRKMAAAIVEAVLAYRKAVE